MANGKCFFPGPEQKFRYKEIWTLQSNFDAKLSLKVHRNNFTTALFTVKIEDCPLLSHVIIVTVM